MRAVECCEGREVRTPRCARLRNDTEVHSTGVLWVTPPLEKRFKGVGFVAF